MDYEELEERIHEASEEATIEYIDFPNAENAGREAGLLACLDAVKTYLDEEEVRKAAKYLYLTVDISSDRNDDTYRECEEFLRGVADAFVTLADGMSD